MTAQSFTPGPWSNLTVLGGQVEDCVWAETSPSDGGDIICLSPLGEGYEDSASRWKANSCLIAAAPDLYAVAEYMEDLLLRYEINHVSGEAISDAALEIVRSAIAKARGEVK